MEHYRALPSLPHLSPLQSAPRKRLVMSWWDREVRIWQISRSPHSSRGDGDYSDVEGPAANKLVSRILVQVDLLSEFVKGLILKAIDRARKTSPR